MARVCCDNIIDGLREGALVSLLRDPVDIMCSGRSKQEQTLLQFSSSATGQTELEATNHSLPSLRQISKTSTPNSMLTQLMDYCRLATLNF